MKHWGRIGRIRSSLACQACLDPGSGRKIPEFPAIIHWHWIIYPASSCRGSDDIVSVVKLLCIWLEQVKPPPIKPQWVLVRPIRLHS